MLSDCDVEQAFAAEASASCKSDGFAEQVFQATVDCVLATNEAKNGETEHRLRPKIARQKAALQKLQSKYDNCRELLRKNEANEPVQAFLHVLEAAEEDDKTALFIANQVSNQVSGASQSISLHKFSACKCCFFLFMKPLARNTHKSLSRNILFM